MKRKSRHKRHIEILKKLVRDTDYYVAHVWNMQGDSMHGKVNLRGQQKFNRHGDLANEWYSPFLQAPIAGKHYFCLMPKEKPMSGIVLTGWRELRLFVENEISEKERASNAKDS